MHRHDIPAFNSFPTKRPSLKKTDEYIRGLPETHINPAENLPADEAPLPEISSLEVFEVYANSAVRLGKNALTLTGNSIINLSRLYSSALMVSWGLGVLEEAFRPDENQDSTYLNSQE